MLTWAQTDGWVNRARAQGRKCSASSPTRRRGPSTRSCSAHPCSPAPDKYDEFAAFAAKAANRYKGKVDGLGGLERAERDPLLEADPAAGGLRQPPEAHLPCDQAGQLRRRRSSSAGSRPTTRNDARWLTWRTFMDRFYAAGDAPYDKFAIHPYYSGGRPMTPVARQPLLQPAQDAAVPRSRTATATRRFWITEFGYETGALTPTKQGERLREALTQVVKWSWVERLFVFSLDGLPGHADQPHDLRAQLRRRPTQGVPHHAEEPRAVPRLTHEHGGAPAPSP